MELRRARPRERTDLRCDCDSLLARLLAGEVEMKCRRCTRVVMFLFVHVVWLFDRHRGSGG